MISQGIEPMKLFLKLKRIQPPTHICNMVHDLSRALLTVTYQDLFGPELWQDIWSCRADDDQGCIRKCSKSNSQQPSQDHWRLDKNSLKSAPPMLFFCQSWSANSRKRHWQCRRVKMFIFLFKNPDCISCSAKQKMKVKEWEGVCEKVFGGKNI